MAQHVHLLSMTSISNMIDGGHVKLPPTAGCRSRRRVRIPPKVNVTSASTTPLHISLGDCSFTNVTLTVNVLQQNRVCNTHQRYPDQRWVYGEPRRR